MRRLKTLSALSAALVLPVAATPAAAGSAMSAAVDGDLDVAWLEESLAALGAAGPQAVVVEVRDGEQVWSAATGDRDPFAPAPHDDPAEPTDLVRVGSVTKSMIVTVVLQLVAEGRLSLDDAVADHLPGVLPYDEPITVRQLLGHTSGVPNHFPLLYPSLAQGSAEDLVRNQHAYFRPPALVEFATRGPLDFAPGAHYWYSNTGYAVIGLLVEELTGQPIEDELERRVFEPAGLTDTTFPRHGTRWPGEHPDGFFATGDPAEPYVETTQMSASQFWAAGAVVSTTADTNRFFRAMFDGTLLPEGLLAEARTLTPQSEGTYGLGIQAVAAPCEPIGDGGLAFGHTGGTFGHSTYAFSSPDGERQVSVVLSIDDQLAPSEERALALNELLVAGLCGSTTAPAARSAGVDVLGELEIVRG
ncbi:serine hydrolase domain-containing protein [Jiangella mangrovi]|uniref:D-alanyl-D-alanine carboxypeptidase n=1 Tax=Jiangella mangrovi TaxID=1524084 RepID=A0A7W9GSY2_9ACTN|nr:serine hydrolase domain-containing protein [Jiangella mangrovi]MBB5789468.1 D-alanyl-D-alanine carboxypeptidase [Jiangella mangrovi]